MALGNIPNDLRVPLFYMEFDNSLAVSGTPTMPNKILVLGQMAVDASATALTQYPITNDDQPAALFGNSMITDTLNTLRKANSYTETIAMPIGDLASGAAAKATDGFVVSGSAQASGTLYLMIAGTEAQVGVEQGDTAEAIASKIVDFITTNANDYCVTASIGDPATQVVLTANWKGETGNDIDLRCNYYVGNTFPKGVKITAGTMNDGSGTPDMSEIIAHLGDEWFNHIVCPWNDQASLNTLRDELVERWGPLKMMEAIAYTAVRGTHAETSTWGETRNDFLITCMGTNLMPTPPWEMAASYAGIGAYNLNIDPARPLQTLVLPGVKPPRKEDAWDVTERNLHLHDGVATYFVDASGNVCIEREISTYQVNAFGSPDPSYLDITTPATLGYYRYAMKAHITQKYPRHKLAGDDVLDSLEPGQPVVTPKIMRTDFLEKFVEFQGKGLVEDYDDFKNTLQVTRDTDDANRLNVVCSPNLINGLRVLATLTQFKL